MNNTWRVILTKSDAEPWWFFEGWEKEILKEWSYSDKESAIDKFLEEINILFGEMPNAKTKKYNSIAFWDPNEVVFCDACDDDLQMYYGLIIFENNKPMEISEVSNLGEIIRDIIGN